MKKALPIYHIERVIMETGELFDDKSHIIYVNNEIKDNTPLGMLMHLLSFRYEYILPICDVYHLLSTTCTAFSAILRQMFPRSEILLMISLKSMVCSGEHLQFSILFI